MMRRFRVVFGTGLHTNDDLEGEVGFSFVRGTDGAEWAQIEALTPGSKGSTIIELNSEAMDALANAWLALRETMGPPPAPWVPSTREGWLLWEQLHKERASGAQA